MSVVVEDSLRRLGAALQLLELTIGRRLEAEHRRGDLETELQIMQDDRAELARDLDRATVRLTHVETTADEIDRRLGSAIGTLAEVLAPAGAARTEG